MGAITQSRALGGVIGFAITWNVFNAYIRHGLSGVLESAQLEELLQSLAQTSAELSPDRQQIVADTFARAYDLENTILIGFAVAQIAVVALLWEKDFRRLS
nr:hypothetical protein CFP56_07783 [Quercus suber]